MNERCSLVGCWSAEQRTLAFNEDGTFILTKPKNESTGRYKLTGEHPIPERAVFWPIPSSGLFLRLDFDMPPDALPHFEVWAVDEIAPERLVMRYPTQMIEGEFMYPWHFREVKLNRLVAVESQPVEQKEQR